MNKSCCDFGSAVEDCDVEPGWPVVGTFDVGVSTNKPSGGKSVLVAKPVCVDIYQKQTFTEGNTTLKFS